MEPRIANDYAPQPSASDAEIKHPRYGEYARYRSSLARQLVTAMPFRGWLEAMEKEENGHSGVYEVTSKTARLAPGWYKNVFPPNSKGRCYTYGPVATRQQAERLGNSR